MFEEYRNNGMPKVYLASPFFNDEQVERIEFMEALLSELNYDVFSPRKASLITKDSTKQDMVETFNGNVSHIDTADFVLAIMDGSDVGTVWETGYAFKARTPILYFRETKNKPNLMLAMSTNLPFIAGDGSREKVREVLTQIKDKSLEKFIKEFKGNEFDEVE